MSEAPERIWAWPFKDWFRGGCSTHKVKAKGAKDVEFVRADLARPAQSPQEGWQPIKTAPRDGTEILLFGQRAYAPCTWSPAGEISEDGFWLWWQMEPEYLTEVKSPTHWMPLPKPPVGEKSE